MIPLCYQKCLILFNFLVLLSFMMNWVLTFPLDFVQLSFIEIVFSFKSFLLLTLKNKVFFFVSGPTNALCLTKNLAAQIAGPEPVGPVRFNSRKRSRIHSVCLLSSTRPRTRREREPPRMIGETGEGICYVGLEKRGGNFHWFCLSNAFNFYSTYNVSLLISYEHKGSFIPVCLWNRLISTELEPVLSH